MGVLLETRGISKSFGGVQALERIDLSVERGEVLGVIGPNGAGKTTLFNVICGLKPTAGRVLFKDEDITGLRPHEICRRGIARTFQLTRPFAEISVQDNVAAAVLFGRSHPRGASLAEARRRADLVLARVKRRLELARALATSPELLLLDEVMAGLTVAEAEEMVEILGRLRREFTLTLLVIEHVMKVVMTICERLVVLNYGSKLTEGAPHEVAAHREVIDAYLGVEHA